MLHGMRWAVVVLVGALVLGGCKGTAPTNTDPGSRAAGVPAGGAARQRAAGGANFDYYLLNISWSPEYCHGHPSAPECAAHAAFVLHGLWPENTDGSYPKDCSSAPGPANPAQYGDIFPDAGLLEHEWKTHGTCSGLDPDTYFQTARKAYQSVVIPEALSGLKAQTSMTPAEIVASFRGSNAAIPESSFAVSCGNNYLTAVEVCLSKTLEPAACTGIRTCRANTVKIPAP